MWMLLIASCLRNKDGLLFHLLGEFCFYGGMICGTLGIVMNTNFGNHPTLADYNVFKGLLSHSTMLLGCIYMLTGHFIKIRMFNVVSISAGITTFIVCGASVNKLYELFGLQAPDGMWLRSNPYIDFPPMMLGYIFVLVLFVVLHIRDLRKPAQDRWYRKIARRIHHERPIH
jgi:hypothetical protein